jgi:hypothetical protein
MEKHSRKEFLASLGMGLGLTLIPEARADDDKRSYDVRDYGAIGDGKTDATQAFQRCLLLHKVAYVPAGVWIVNNLTLDGMKLYGEGTLKLSKGENVLTLLGRGNVVQGLGFHTTNNRAKAEIRLGEGCQDVQISGCRFLGAAYSVLAADQNGENDLSLKYKKPVKRVIFTHNFVSGYVVPLYLHSVEDMLISGNFFADSFYDAIRLRQGIQRVVISQNFFENIGTSKEEVSRDAVDSFWSGRELIISDNIVKKTGCIGFDIKGHEPQGRYHTQNIVVANNLIEDTYYTGILLSSGGAAKKPFNIGPASIKNNTITGGNRKSASPFEAAIWLHHGTARVQVIGNQISKHRGHGIGVSNAFKGAAKTKFVQITQNMIVDCQHKGEAAGIYAQDVEDLMMTHNMIEGCDLSWSFERIPDLNAFRKNALIESNFFKGPGKAIPMQDWPKYLEKTNKVLP